MKLSEKWRGRVEVGAFVFTILWVVFATWCAVQNAERDQEKRDHCTCGAFE